MNDGGQTARAFHDRTAHSYQSVRAGGHWLDWDVKPRLFKIYPDLPVTPLASAFDPVLTDTLVALMGSPEPAAESVTLETLASVLFFSAGLTRTRVLPGGEQVQFRAAPSTGALYQTEVYIVAGPIRGLEAGVYHFAPAEFGLRRLRAGDFRQALAEAAADPDLARRPVAVILSAIYWRNTWKYQARAYRHFFWDSGSMLANLTAVAAALGLESRVRAGFVDADVNALLGLDVEREASLEVVSLGPFSPPAPGSPPVLPIAHRMLALSSEETDYPLLREVHARSTLATESDVRAWRRPSSIPAPLPRSAPVVLPAPRPAAGRALGETIRRRGSTRRFSRGPLAAVDLATTLAVATRGVRADFPADLVALYLVVNAVGEIDPGAYRYWPAAHGLEPIRAGDFRAQSAHLCLEQSLGGDAAAVVYFLAPLDLIVGRWGSRGYRIANLAAGIAGGRAYLAAYGQGFGATGLTFYDGEVVRFFAPHAAGLDAVFVTALGHAARGAAGEAALLQIR